MSKKLFVGGLSWGVRDEALKEAFAVHGDVQEAIVILERGTNRSRGFGFVTFATEEEAQTAMESYEWPRNRRKICTRINR